jgi:hypothetical protein
MDRSLIDQYDTGAQKLQQAIAGLTEADLHAKPVPGKWSTHQVVLHMADSEAAIADRIRRIIAEDEPTLLYWDETKFSQKLHYEKQSTADALELIRLTRRQTVRILRSIGELEFERVGVHSVRGRMSLRNVISAANGHLDHHLKFVREKREKLGKPIKD